MSRILIMVATHKRYRMPDDTIYFPVHVGAQGKTDLGFTPDCTGEHISKKNPNYCELTGLYWIWKNTSSDYLGLAHYRRHFIVHRKRDLWNGIATRGDIETMLKDCDVILPHKRNYVIESTYQQYAHAHHAVDLDTTREILAQRYPNYLSAFDRAMKKTTGHKFNMFIMKRELADAYCEWLFSVLFELEERLDISTYNQNDQRVFGFVSERLLDVWLDTNGITYREMPVAFLEKQNWFIKGGNFLLRKLGIKKQ